MLQQHFPKEALNKGIELSTQACELGSTLSCHFMATLYLIGEHIQQDKLQAWHFAQKGCQLAHEPSCLIWIDLTLNHHNLQISNSKAITKARQGAEFFCEKHPSIQSCTLLERYYVYLMKTVPNQSLQAYESETLHLKYAEKLCDLGQFSSCNQLGLLYALGVGSQNQKEPQQAISFFKKGCEGDYMESCIHLGKAYLQGKGVEVNEERGNTLLQHACNQGYTSVCRQETIQPQSKFPSRVEGVK
jgi:uncharacterized protein